MCAFGVTCWLCHVHTPPLLNYLARLPCYRTQCSWLPLPSAPYLVHLAGQVCQHKPHAALCSWLALSNNGCLCSTPAQRSRPTLLTHCGCATLQVCAVYAILGAPAKVTHLSRTKHLFGKEIVGGTDFVIAVLQQTLLNLFTSESHLKHSYVYRHRVREHVRGCHRLCAQTLNAPSRTRILSSRCTLQP